MLYVLIALGLNIQPIHFESKALCQNAKKSIVKHCQTYYYKWEQRRCVEMKQKLVCVKRKET